MSGKGALHRQGQCCGPHLLKDFESVPSLPEPDECAAQGVKQEGVERQCLVLCQYLDMTLESHTEDGANNIVVSVLTLNKITHRQIVSLKEKICLTSCFSIACYFGSDTNGGF